MRDRQVSGIAAASWTEVRYAVRGFTDGLPGALEVVAHSVIMGRELLHLGEHLGA